MVNKLKILNLHCGIGGNRKLWKDVEVTAVEYNQEIADVYKKFYPKDKVIVEDAYEFLVKHYDEFDFIWASPPCQSHSKIGYISMKTREKFNRGELPTKSRSKDIILPDLRLYGLIIFLQHFYKHKKWIVENVVPYYEPLIKPSIKLDRHLIWSNFNIAHKDFDKPQVKHNKVTGKTERYGISLDGFKLKHRKDQIVRNCVNPELGLHILNCAFKQTQTLLPLSQNQEGGNGIPPKPKGSGILPKDI